jgi:hypothetical protein
LETKIDTIARVALGLLESEEDEDEEEEEQEEKLFDHVMMTESQSLKMEINID